MIVPNKSIKIFFNRVIGPLLFIVLSYSIYLQLLQQPDLHRSLQHIKEAIYGSQAWKCWLAVALMLVNWLIEAGKWKLLLRPWKRFH